MSMGLVSHFRGRLVFRPRKREQQTEGEAPLIVTEPEVIVKPIIIAGFGRVGQNVARGLQDVGIEYGVIEIDPERIFAIQCGGTACIYGDASNARVLSRVDLAKARVLVVTFPDPLAVMTTVKNALAINPDIRIVARIHRVREAELLKKLGVEELISPEYEASLEFLRKTLSAVGWRKADINQALTIIQKDEDINKFSEEEEG